MQMNLCDEVEIAGLLFAKVLKVCLEWLRKNIKTLFMAGELRADIRTQDLQHK
jgi:hypothetical protein